MHEGDARAGGSKVEEDDEAGVFGLLMVQGCGFMPDDEPSPSAQHAYDGEKQRGIVHGSETSWYVGHRNMCLHICIISVHLTWGLPTELCR